MSPQQFWKRAGLVIAVVVVVNLAVYLVAKAAGVEILVPMGASPVPLEAGLVVVFTVVPLVLAAVLLLFLRRVGVSSPAVFAGLAAVVLLLSLALALAACGARDDPFAGLWWEPATGRRIEIRVTGDSYKVLYGAARAPFPATRSGDELRVTDPLGGVTVFKQAGDGTLTLSAAGKTSVLKRVPQHQ